MKNERQKKMFEKIADISLLMVIVVMEGTNDFNWMWVLSLFIYVFQKCEQFLFHFFFWFDLVCFKFDVGCSKNKLSTIEIREKVKACVPKCCCGGCCYSNLVTLAIWLQFYEAFQAFDKKNIHNFSSLLFFVWFWKLLKFCFCFRFFFTFG